MSHLSRVSVAQRLDRAVGKKPGAGGRPGVRARRRPAGRRGPVVSASYSAGHAPDWRGNGGYVCALGEIVFISPCWALGEIRTGTPILAASWQAQFPADAAGSATGLASCTQYPAACTSVLVVVRAWQAVLVSCTANRAGMHAAQV